MIGEADLRKLIELIVRVCCCVLWQRNESITASNRTLKNDIREVDDEDIDVETVKEYLDILERLFLTDNQPPFAAGVRSSVRVKQAVKRHFCDPSLACALLKTTPAGLPGDLETLGLLFEALCERDLRKIPKGNRLLCCVCFAVWQMQHTEDRAGCLWCRLLR